MPVNAVCPQSAADTGRTPRSVNGIFRPVELIIPLLRCEARSYKAARRGGREGGGGGKIFGSGLALAKVAENTRAMTLRTFAILLCFQASAFAADPLLQEPPLKLTVTIGGKEVPLIPGEEKKVEGEFKDPVIKVSAGAVRTFSLAGISFDYPAGWNWEAEKGDNSYTWTIEGPDVTLILSKYVIEMDAKSVAEAMTESGDSATKIEAWSGTHGGREFKGWKVAGGSPLIYVMTIPVKNGSALLQVIDSTDDGKPSADYLASMELLGKTLQTGAK